MGTVLHRLILAICFGLWISGAALAQHDEIGGAHSRALPENAPPLREKVTIKYAARDEYAPVRYDAWKGGVFFEVNVAGKPAWALLDTGADYSLMDSSFADRIGLEATSLDETIKSSFGESSAGVVKDVEIDIPKQISLTSSVVSMDLGSLSTLLGRDIAFVLGRNITRHLSVYIRSEDRELYFRNPGGINLHGEHVQVPLDSKGNVTGTILERDLKIEVDTGSNRHVSLDEDIWKAILSGKEVTVENLTADVAGRVRATKTANPVPFRLGALHTEVPVSSRPSSESSSVGSLGMGFLSRYNILIDQSRGVLILAPYPS